ISNKFVTVTYNADLKLLTYKWTGIVNYDLGVEAFKKTMQFIQNYPCYFVLHDATEMSGTFTRLNDFMSKEVALNFEKHGGKRSALVISSDVFSVFAINQYLKVVKTNNVEIKLFRNLDSAMEWLKEKMLST
ncbi:MAG: hypothetical protein O9262_06385, partial [Cyclobacteriaceae bacterium]|nr:hypothetical protein [Cyclobacteriaceae bacterium]